MNKKFHLLVLVERRLFVPVFIVFIVRTLLVSFRDLLSYAVALVPGVLENWNDP